MATVPPTTAVESTTTVAEPIAAPAAMRAVSLVDRLAVFDGPDGAEVAEIPATTAFGTPTVLGVVDDAAESAPVPGWVHVLLPMRPTGSSGWVRAGDVRLEPVAGEIHIDLATRTLRFVEHGAVVGEWPVAIGTPDRPTPTGRFFVTDKLDTGDPDSVWGSVAVGISAFSGVLTDFIGGVGQIGVHGTNNPDSIGRAAVQRVHPAAQRCDRGAHRPPSAGHPCPHQVSGAILGTMDGASDASLVERVRAGDRAAFGELFERWHDRVFNVARGVVRRPELAADVTQDAFLTAWQRLDRLDDVNAFGGWLLRLTRNRALDVLRREDRSTPSDGAVVAAQRRRGGAGLPGRPGGSPRERGAAVGRRRGAGRARRLAARPAPAPWAHAERAGR